MDGGGVRSHKIQLLLLFFSFKCENFVIPKIGCYRKLLQDARVEAEKSMSKSSYRNWRWVESSDSSVEWFWVFVVERAALWSNREREQRKIGISFQGVMLITFGCSRCRRRSLEVWGQYIRWYFILTRKFVSLSHSVTICCCRIITRVWLKNFPTENFYAASLFHLIIVNFLLSTTHQDGAREVKSTQWWQKPRSQGTYLLRVSWGSSLFMDLMG